MKCIRNYIIFVVLVSFGGINAYEVQAVNQTERQMTVEYLDVSSYVNAALQPTPVKDGYSVQDRRDVGGRCAPKVRISVIKPNGAYGSSFTVSTPGSDCSSFTTMISESQGILATKVIGGIGYNCGSDCNQEAVDIAALLNVFSESFIFANRTAGQITLESSQSLNDAALPRTTSVITANTLEARTFNPGDELLIKGTGAGILRIGNDYSTRTMTLTSLFFTIKQLNPTYTFKGLTGANVVSSSRQALDSMGKAIINPNDQLSLTTPSTPDRPWEIRLKIGN